MNDKRVCQMLLIPYILFTLSEKSGGVAANRVNGYTMGLGRKMVEDQDKLFKISKRTFRCAREIFTYVSVDGRYNGYKIIRIAFYLTQIIFDEKIKLNLSEEDQWILRKIHSVMEYTLYYEHKYRYLNVQSEQDFERLDKSAEKLAPKIFEKFYKNI